jgi:hypothetical protein
MAKSPECPIGRTWFEGSMSISPKKLRLVISLAIVLPLLVGIGVRAIQTRRQARLNDFYKEWFLKKSKTYEDVARDCESYGDGMKELARDNWVRAEAYTKRADYHSQLSRRYWSALVKPWVILPDDPPPPRVPGDD